LDFPSSSAPLQSDDSDDDDADNADGDDGDIPEDAPCLRPDVLVKRGVKPERFHQLFAETGSRVAALALARLEALLEAGALAGVDPTPADQVWAGLQTRPLLSSY